VKPRRPQPPFFTQSNARATQDLSEIQRIQRVWLKEGGATPVRPLFGCGKLLLERVECRFIEMVQDVKPDEADHIIRNRRIANGLWCDLTGIDHRVGEFGSQRIIWLGGDDAKTERQQ
jgi:hypothetical protein